MPEDSQAQGQGTVDGAFALAKDGSVRKVRLSYASGRDSVGSLSSEGGDANATGMPADGGGRRDSVSTDGYDRHTG